MLSEFLFYSDFCMYLYSVLALKNHTDMTTKKVLAVAFIAALSGVAVYTYVQQQKKAKRKNMPINFI